MRLALSSWLIHLAILWVWSVAFAFLPSWATGIPASRLLSSDAEYYAAVTQRLTDPLANTGDLSLAPDLLPSTERASLIALANLARTTHADLLDAWVIYEILAALLFTAALYWLLVTATRSRAVSFVTTLIVSLGVHALGGSAFGFEPRGFVPRDAALGIAVLFVLAYLRTGSDRSRACVFLACGVAANGYSPLFAHLVAVLWLGELAKRRRVTVPLIAFGVLAVLGALPTVIDVAATRVATAPPDPIVFQIRAGYVLVTPLLPALVQYLRRPLLAFAVIIIVYLSCRGRWTDDERARLIPFFRIGLAAALLSAFGVLFEQGTPLARLLLSRSAVFLILASIPICLLGLPIAARGRVRRPPAVGLAAAMIFFALQSNILTDIRSVSAAVAQREQRLDLLRIATALTAQSEHGEIFLAPSEDADDVAASLRTYALRPAYVTYKDLGIVFYDGQRARALYSRWTESEVALQGDQGRLRDFMAAHEIRIAVVHSTAGYELIRR